MSDARVFSRDELPRLAAYPHPQAAAIARLRRLPLNAGELAQLWAQFCFELAQEPGTPATYREPELMAAWERRVHRQRCLREGLYNR